MREAHLVAEPLADLPPDAHELLRVHLGELGAALTEDVFDLGVVRTRV